MYWVLHFPEVADVAHPLKSIYVSGRLIKPVLDLSRIRGRRVFTLTQYAPNLVVAADVRRALEKAGCGGIEFSKMPAA